MSDERSAFEYLSEFKDIIYIASRQSGDIKECYTWCEQKLGVKYRDWFMMLDGNRAGVICGARLYVKNPKKATMFRLRWLDLVA
jgi:hypothetical protein